MRYRVGCVEAPRDDDPTYADQAAAKAAAITMSYNDSVIAVWDTETDEIMCLVYGQTSYWP